MLIFKTTLSTLKDANKQKHKSPTLNRTVQTLLFSFMGNRAIPGLGNIATTSSIHPGVWTVRITSEMWRKGIWNDARSVELMKEAACSDVFPTLRSSSDDQIPRVAMGGVHFFLGRDNDDEKDSDSEDEVPDLKKLRHGQQVGKKTKSRDRQIAAAKALLKKVRLQPNLGMTVDRKNEKHKHVRRI
jgi:protein SDA1